jgi:SulP family sulfate permease
VLVYEIDGPMFFGAIESFEQALLHTHTDPRVLVLRLRRVPFMDVTGIRAMEEVIGKLKKRHVQVVLCEANERVTRKLQMSGLIVPGTSGYFAAFREAIAAVSAPAANDDSSRATERA